MIPIAQKITTKSHFYDGMFNSIASEVKSLVLMEFWIRIQISHSFFD